METPILFSDLLAAGKSHHLITQLLSLKRCFGPTAMIGIVESASVTNRYGTVSQLVDAGHVTSGLEWMDKILPSILTVYDSPGDDFVMYQSKYDDGGPECPWIVAKREQETARVKVKRKRQQLLGYYDENQGR